MCDYSLGGLPNRLATDGEELVVYRFPTGSVGLASVADVEAAAKSRTEVPAKKPFIQTIRSIFDFSSNANTCPAVCVPPGARLTMRTVSPSLAKLWNLQEEVEVTFMQTSADVNTYRDAIRLPDGRHLLLQQLIAGMRLRVISCAGSASDQYETLPPAVHRYQRATL